MLSAINVITTVAGLGSFGFSGDGGPATAAELKDPFGVAVDVSGNIYIADTINHRIRRVDSSTSIITTVAGVGSFGFSGDGGPATAAELENPIGVAVDVSGNIYIADTSNQRIRRVNMSSPPTFAPTAKPSLKPTACPSSAPTTTPTYVPTIAPTSVPSAIPTAKPSLTPITSKSPLKHRSKPKCDKKSKYCNKKISEEEIDVVLITPAGSSSSKVASLRRSS